MGNPLSSWGGERTSVIIPEKGVRSRRQEGILKKVLNLHPVKRPG